MLLRSRNNNTSTTPQLQLPSLTYSNNTSTVHHHHHHIKHNSMNGINRNTLKQSFLNNNMNTTYTTYNTNNHIMFNCITQPTHSPECVAMIAKKNATMHKVHTLLKNSKNVIKRSRPLIQIIKDLKNAKTHLDKNRDQKIVQYFKNAITHKVHPKSMDMIYKIEHSRDNIHLQKLILNVEYKKQVIDKHKDTTFTDDNERVNYVMNQKVFEEVKNRIKNNKHKRSNSHITPGYNTNIHVIKVSTNSNNNNNRIQHNKLSSSSTTTTSNAVMRVNNNKASKNKVHKNKRTRIRHVSDGCIVLKEKECKQDIEKFNSEEFAERYMNINQVVDSEMNMHYKNQVLKTDDIDVIRKSKYDILLQRLKDDYIDKYNTFKEYQIGKDIQKRHQEKLIRNNIVIRKVGFKKRHDVNFLMPRTEEQNDKLKHKLSKAIDDHKKKRNIKLPFKINIEFFEPLTPN